MYGTHFAGHWFNAALARKVKHTPRKADATPVEFPDMRDKQNVTWGARSGVIMIGL